ncbi:flagellar motor stator protein MotA [Chitinasiproducens palmae]|uniref:Chemotaxis protein MotA n=1 Tax=Chitinasiproducens palmae TaxID=1770053 RepID=A0A1H2PL00_9BURK|nr:flagellar motor stator protein MotA [Chitinasiproducens palmae]SDV46647.1 chemotaxis protein MotA [Chitinasiproducens palmae]
MLVFLGYVVTVVSVFGGYALAGGHLAALLQPVEFLMIAGAGFGAFLVGNNTKAIRATFRALPQLLRRTRYTKPVYMDLMAVLFLLLTKARRDGLMSLEDDIEAPADSALFKTYPRILGDALLMDFLTDYFRLMVSGNMNAFELENLMDEEIETHHQESTMPAHCLTKVGDAMPAFGIVAAVMGVVHTMASASLPPARLGELLAQALVGTFLGILLAYGFIAPLAQAIEQRVEESTKILQCIKVGILASLNGYPPSVAVEFSRKVLFSTERPTFAELEAHVKQVRGEARRR